MGAFYQTTPNEEVLIYTYKNQINYRIKRYDNFSKSRTLAQDYQNCFCNVFHNNNIYYSYINSNNELILRRTSDNTILFLLENISYMQENAGFTPTLASFNKRLLLFYVTYEHQSYQLKCILPLNQDLTINLKTLPKLTAKSHFTIFSGKRSLYLEITDVLSSDIANRNISNPDKSNNFITNNLLYEINRKLQLNRLESESKLSQNISALKEKHYNETTQLNNTITSITRQYNELMSVAQHYKDEAIKWRNKFVSK